MVSWPGRRESTPRPILWAAGVAASPIGRTLGVPVDKAGRVIVNPDLTVPGHANVFVIGDLAALPGADGRQLPGVAQVAMQMGVHAAGNIMRAIERQPLRPFAYRDYGNMATVGRALGGGGSALAALEWIHRLDCLAVRAHLMQLVGFRNRIVVLVQWAWAYFSYQRAIRLITGGPADRSVMPRRWWTVAAFAAAAALVPLPPSFVERCYSRRDLPSAAARDHVGVEPRAVRAL